MVVRTAYFPGGLDSAAPAGNRAEEWDSAGGYTRWSPAGVVVESRALTPAEVAQLAGDAAGGVAAVNVQTVQQRAQAALAANATFLALGAPTNAQILAQVRLLTKECNALIRLALGQVSDVSDTA